MLKTVLRYLPWALPRSAAISVSVMLGCIVGAGIGEGVRDNLSNVGLFAEHNWFGRTLASSELEAIAHAAARICDVPFMEVLFAPHETPYAGVYAPYFTPRFYVVLNPWSLSAFSRTEKEAVVAHEIWHYLHTPSGVHRIFADGIRIVSGRSLPRLQPRILADEQAADAFAARMIGREAMIGVLLRIKTRAETEEDAFNTSEIAKRIEFLRRLPADQAGHAPALQ
jgi:hypothetical protein